MTEAVLLRWFSVRASSGGLLVVLIAALLVTTAGIVHASLSSRRSRKQATLIERRPIDDAPSSTEALLALPPHRYRVRVERAILAQLPLVSARTTAIVVAVVMLFSSLLLPASLRLPRWIEIEMVLAAWWAMSFAFLTVLLYRGTRFREDHAFRVRWNLPDLGLNKKARTPFSAYERYDPGCDMSCLEIPGCDAAVLGVLLAVVALVLAWFIIELALPVVFFFVYWLVVQAIVRVANDNHACEKQLRRSIVWGGLWATTYAFPLAVVIYGVHWFAGHR